MRIPTRLTAVPTVVAALLSGCSDKPTGIGAGPPPPKETVLGLVAAESTETGWEAVIPAFAATEQGRDVTVRASFGPSGQQSRAVADGSRRPDLVGFATEPEITRLVGEGRVAPQWNGDVTGGLPFGSVVTLVVRAGNPRDIAGWDDLLRPGVEAIAPAAPESGTSVWSLLAAYAAGSDGGRDEKAGLEYVRRLVSADPAGPPDPPSEAVERFLRGEADVLIAPENEAIDLRSADVEYVIPVPTLRIGYPVAVLTTSTALRKATALRNFLFTPEGQRIWARAGFRPVDPAIAEEFDAAFPQPPVLWTVGDLGGWDTLYPALFDPDSGAITAIYREATR